MSNNNLPWERPPRNYISPFAPNNLIHNTANQQSLPIFQQPVWSNPAASILLQSGQLSNASNQFHRFVSPFINPGVPLHISNANLPQDLYNHLHDHGNRSVDQSANSLAGSSQNLLQNDASPLRSGGSIQASELQTRRDGRFLDREKRGQSSQSVETYGGNSDRTENGKRNDGSKFNSSETTNENPRHIKDYSSNKYPKNDERQSKVASDSYDSRSKSFDRFRSGSARYSRDSRSSRSEQSSSRSRNKEAEFVKGDERISESDSSQTSSKRSKLSDTRDFSGRSGEYRSRNEPRSDGSRSSRSLESYDRSRNERSSASGSRRQYDSDNRSEFRFKYDMCREASKKSSYSKDDKDYGSDQKSSGISSYDTSSALSSKEIFESDNEQSVNDEDVEEKDATCWTRCSPATLYYKNSPDNPSILTATEKLCLLQEKFRDKLIERGVRVRASKPTYEKPVRKLNLCKGHRHGSDTSSDDSDDSNSDDENNAMEEMEWKKKHPDRLHEELWFNDPGEMNDGPLCRCSVKASRTGIRHSIYPGEENLKSCDYYSNNSNRLHHYRITMSPHTNFITKQPTTIMHDGHEFIFEGFSLFSHTKLNTNLPQCKIIRFNIEYTILYIEEKFPENFTVRGLELFDEYLFKEILELVDLDFKAHNDKDGCQQYHLMPRFVRILEENGKEILSMSEVLQYFIENSKDLVDSSKLKNPIELNNYDWKKYTNKVKGMIATNPLMKPCSIRVDQLDRDQGDEREIKPPEIVHFGVKPPQLSYAGNSSYQKAWREYVKFRHLLANKPKVSYTDRDKLQQKEMVLQEMRTKNNFKRDVTVAVSSKGFYRTGIMCDIVQHAMLIPVLICHLRFHKALDVLENAINYTFKDRYLLQLALTHPSYRENFGTNPDHARNSLSNCGIRQLEYGDRRIHFVHTRKRGISTLINIMSRFGQQEETASSINHNERLEFLGDAVVEFISSIHLFHMFPELEEGGLATYRAAIVQNQHLALLAKHLELEKFMLFAHGSDLCHDLELRHAMANCFEALMGALFLDGGINVADRVFSNTLFPDSELKNIWVNYPQHILQEQEPHGDRKWIESVPLLQKLTKFEDMIGIRFTHIRLLARSFTMRSLGYNHLTLGSNQRLEFLGDTVLQLIASEYLYKFFPEHHEGHLSLLRSSLVNNRTQSVVCDDIGMVEFSINTSAKQDLKTKDKADLLEAFLGALYVDKGLEYCKVFCQVCFFPRLQDFIMNQDWNDPKSKLQQCCLTLRSIGGGEPDIPIYKVIESKGPTNTRIYIVAVYFRGKRLSKGSGQSIQLAEMDAANNALASSKELFPQLVHQERVIQKSMKRRRP